MKVRLRPKRSGKKKIDSWRRLLKTTPELMPRVSRAMAEETLNLIKDGFREERDPFGRRWKKKQRSDGRKVLSGETSRLKNWVVRFTNKTKFRVGASVAYSVFHQHGTKTTVPRRMVPSMQLPAKWESTYRELVEGILRAHFGR